MISQPGTRDLWIIPTNEQKEQQVKSSNEGKPILALVISRLQTHEGFFCQIRLVPASSLPDTAHLVLERPIPTLLGLTRLKGEEDYLVVVTDLMLLLATTGTGGKPVYRVHNVVLLAISKTMGDFGTTAVLSPGGYVEDAPNTSPVPSVEYYISSICKLLSSGSFYLGESLFPSSDSFDFGPIDNEFVWNGHILEPINQLAEQLPEAERHFLKASGMFSPVMQGFLGIKNGPGFVLQVESKLSCRRAGTRYRSRGIDDDGNVANFVQSTVKLSLMGNEFSYVILRGSVPVFWDQQGIQLGYPRIQLTRSPSATQPAFNAHFDRLVENYGNQHVLDLLSQRDGQVELLLSNAYTFHLKEYSGALIPYTAFDVHAVCKSNDFTRLNTILPLIIRDLERFSFSLNVNGEMKKTQSGTFRVNCLDCLDRTNLIQGFIIKQMIDHFLRTSLNSDVASLLDVGELDGLWNDLWADNGDALSMVYTGTGALRSSYTRSGKRTLSGFMDDVKKTATRFYVNNFVDKDRQVSVDLVLGRLDGVSDPVRLFNPISKAIQEELGNRSGEFSEQEYLRVYCVTWNCGGTLPEDLGDDQIESLFFPQIEKEKADFDLIIVTFQEIVELNAAQIMTVDPERRLQWETAISHVLRPHYSFLVGNQLVGTLLFLFCKTSLLEKIRGVELGSKKTGLGGIAGNKGSIAIRLEWYDTPICIVASHFCAGQSAWRERDSEFLFIKDSLGFSRGRTILGHHQHVIWFGDLNYRIESDRSSITSVVNGLVQREDLQVLSALDQLSLSREKELAFKNFVEGPLTFPPTYKFDPGTDDYDTSEKARAPAWTDRILLYSHTTQFSQISSYSSIPDLKASDHRAVFGKLILSVQRIDREKRAQIQADLYERYSQVPVQKRPLPPIPSNIEPPPIPPRISSKSPLKLGTIKKLSAQ